ncbi:hypothetical protein EDB80DRAFT_757450 [Ilyonectria destructans]|nr:hypothetical protein EDB80DRAFT_757450 [Ilyonectria destructans]
MVVLRDPPFDRTIIPTSHKRRHLSCSSPASPTDVAHRSSKKPKLSHPAIPPPRFWDDLSEIHLTRNALGELDRRNAKVARDSTRRRKCRIRRATVEKIESPQPGFLGQCSPTCLRQIKRFATHGGPDLSNLRGYRALDPAYGMSSSKSSLGRRKRGSQSPSKSGTTANTTTTKSTGPYDRAFQQHLIDYSVFPDDYEYPDGHLPLEPENLDDILRALRQPRASLSPSRFSNEDFRKFKRADTQASKERQVTTNVIPIIERDVRDGKCVAGEVPFTNLDHLTDGTLVPGNPDLYYGARPEQLDREVRREPDVKGPDGSLPVASRQACYDGALGARGIHSLQSYGTLEPHYDNKAYTLTSIYHGGTLKVYASHPIGLPTSGAQPGFVMTQLNSWSLTGNAQAFREGVAAYRNGRDWTKQQRDQAITQANEKVAGLGIAASPQSDVFGLGFASEASAIEATSQETIKNLSSHALPSL